MAEVVALPGMAYSRSGNAPAKAKRKAPARRRPDRGPRAAAAPAPPLMIVLGATAPITLLMG